MTTTSLATISIQRDPQYSALRICAQTCVDRGNDNSDLEGHLQSGDSTILNACFCRQDLRPKASTFLSSCVISRCKYNNQDLTSVYKVYDGYCSFKPVSATTTSASTTKRSTTTGGTKVTRKEQIWTASCSKIWISKLTRDHGRTPTYLLPRDPPALNNF